MDIQEISNSNVDQEKEGEVEQLTDETQKLDLDSDGMTEGGGGGSAPEPADHHQEEHSHMPSES